MNTDMLEGNWMQLKGKVRETWGKLTDDDVDVIAGKRDQLVGKLQERYGKTKEVVQEEVTDFERSMRNAEWHAGNLSTAVEDKAK